jgi:chemotaxis protein CheX
MLDEASALVRDAFISGTQAALSEMASAEAAVVSTEPATTAQVVDSISAVVELNSVALGRFILSLPRGTAAALAERILAGVEDVIDDELTRDCVGELANVIAGQAKTILAGTPSHFNFSLPRVYGPGSSEPTAGPSGTCQLVRFGTELGVFTLLLEMLDPAAPAP